MLSLVLRIQWGVLSTLTSALTAFNPRAVNVKSKEDFGPCCRNAYCKIRSSLCLDLQKNQWFPLNHGDNSLNLCERISTK